MKKQLFNILLALNFVLITVLASSCKKTEEKSTAPVLEVISVNKTSLIEFKDSLIVTLSYEDVNGDLGQLNPDENALLVKDARIANGDYYHIPPITPDQQNLKTKGTFQVFIPSLFLLGNGGFEKTIISFQVKDRDNNISNTATTPEVSIIRE